MTGSHAFRPAGQPPTRNDCDSVTTGGQHERARAGRHIDGREALARMYPRTETWREGYYEGETDDGGRVLFLVPSKTNMIARFQVDLDLLTTSATEQDYPSECGFEARDVRISELYGAFRHSSCQHGLFALHGGLGFRRNGSRKVHRRRERRGTTRGLGNRLSLRVQQLEEREAAWKTTEDDPNAPSFRAWDC
jgi:hypothetical protein